MAAVPKVKISKGRRNKRRMHHKVKDVNFTLCLKCGTARKPHQKCPNCGYYK